MDKKTKIVNLLVVAVLLLAVPLGIGAVEWRNDAVSNEWIAETAHVYSNDTRFVDGYLFDLAYGIDRSGGFFVHWNATDVRENVGIGFYNASLFSDGLNRILLDVTDTTDSATLLDRVVLGFNVSVASLVEYSATRFCVTVDAGGKNVSVVLRYQSNATATGETVVDLGTFNASVVNRSVDIDLATLMTLDSSQPNGHFYLLILSTSETEELAAGDTVLVSMEFQHKRGSEGLWPMDVVAAVIGVGLFLGALVITPFVNPLDRRGDVLYIPYSVRKKRRVKGHARYHKGRYGPGRRW